MGTLGNPKTWVPYMNSKDCTQGFCSLSCPQWCYIIFPPPPPFNFPDDNTSQSAPIFSPLVITIIGILASAFLLVSYYAIISKFCGNSDSISREIHPQNQEDNHNHDDNHDHGHDHHEPWLIRTTGLDESLIKAITIVKYKKRDGLIGRTNTTDCSVCLGEFLEDENLRLLPKCNHAFHVVCIDTWLKSHSNCPLCRANIVVLVHPPTPLMVANDDDNQVDNEEIRSNGEGGRQMGVVEEQSSGNLPKCPFRAFSDLDFRGHDRGQMMRRSISMDHLHETRVSISEILRFDHGEDCHEEEVSNSGNCNSSGSSSSNHSRSRVLNCVMNSVAMKRSFSSGRFLFSKHGRGKNAIIPV